ncbi:hypothetical protein GCM10009621_12050 [Corynebacterium felinum]
MDAWLDDFLNRKSSSDENTCWIIRASSGAKTLQVAPIFLSPTEFNGMYKEGIRNPLSKNRRILLLNVRF